MSDIWIAEQGKLDPGPWKIADRERVKIKNKNN